MNALKSSRFIYLATKPYFKKLRLVAIVLLAAGAAEMMTSKGSHLNTTVTFSVYIFIISVLISSYGFYAYDKNPQLFSALPQKRNDFVKGVYLNYVILMAGDIAAGLTILLMLRLLGSSDVGLLFFLGLVSFGFALNTAIEFPIALKVGYARMQTVTLIVLVTLAFAPTIAVHIFHLETAIAWAVSHLKQLDNPIIFAGFVIMALSALTVSYRWSIHIYSKEDI